MELLWDGKTKVCSKSPGHMTKMAAICGKNLKSSSSLESKGWWPWNLVCSIGCSSTTKFIQMMTQCWPWPIYGNVKFGPLWRPSLSCDWDHSNKLSFPHPKVRFHMKFGFNRPQCLLRKRSLKKLNLRDFYQGQSVTLTFGTHKASCAHLVDCIYQLLYHRLP